MNEKKLGQMGVKQLNGMIPKHIFHLKGFYGKNKRVKKA